MNAASVVLVLDRCVRDEPSNYANQYANQALQAVQQNLKGGSYRGSSRSSGAIVTGCVRMTSSRGQFVRRLDDTLRGFALNNFDSPAHELNLPTLLDYARRTRLPLEVNVEYLSDSPLNFAFTRAGARIDPALEERIRNRSGPLDGRLDAISTLANTVSLEKPDSPITRAAMSLFAQLATDRDDDPQVRGAALQQLSRQRDETTERLFTEVTFDETATPVLRIMAMDALVAVAATSAHDIVLKQLSASSPEVRGAAIRQFSRVAKPDDIALLLKRLNEEDVEEPLIELIQTAATLNLTPQQLLPPLHRILSTSASSDARREAIGAISSFNLEESYEPLSKVVLDKSQPAPLRVDAVFAIGKLDFKDAERKDRAAILVMQAAKDGEPAVRRATADTLGKLKVPKTRPALDALARDPEPRTREGAAMGLGDFGDATATPVLEGLLKDPASAVRRAAARSLGNFPGPRSASALTAATNDPDASVRAAAATALKRSAASDELVDALVRSIGRAKDPREKARAIRLLPPTEDARAIGALVASLETNDKDVREAAIAKLGATPGTEVVRQLTLALASKDDGTRAGAAAALGRIGENAMPASPAWQQALSALTQMPLDRDTGVRIAAARALGSFGDPTALNAILQYSKDSRDSRLDVSLAAADGLRALAASYSRANNLIMAIDAGSRAADLRQRLVGENNVETATDLNNLGAYNLLAEDLINAEQNLQHSLAIRERVLGVNDLDTAVSLANLATVYVHKSDLMRAEPLFLRVLSIRERALSQGDPAVTQTLENLSSLYIKMGDTGRAEKYQQRIKSQAAIKS